MTMTRPPLPVGKDRLRATLFSSFTKELAVRPVSAPASAFCPPGAGRPLQAALEEFLARGRWLVFSLLGVAALLALLVDSVAKTSLPGERLLRRAFATAPPIEERLTGDLQGFPGKATRREPKESFSEASSTPVVRGAHLIERRALDRPGTAEL